jgi:hypothetical protein
MRKILRSAFLLLCFSAVVTVKAQDEGLDDLLGDPGRLPVTASFKSTRVINSASLEITDAGTMDIKIQHRFGPLNSGAYELWGLDASSVRIGAEWGLGGNTMIGLGRSGEGQTYDAYGKWKMFAQTRDNHIPVSVLLFSAAALRGQALPGVNEPRGERLSYVQQLIIGRKFSDAFSLQLMPTWVHHRSPNTGGAQNLAGLGAAFRMKISPRTSFNAEYVWFPSDRLPRGVNVPLSIGFDIETGGHVFQLHLTNSSGMADKSWLSETRGDFFRGGIRPGFNITRVFTLWQPKSR